MSGPGRTARSDIQQVAFQRPPLAGTHVLARRPLPLTVPAGPNPAAAMPLDGLRVVDLSSVFAGPHCARYLADFGRYGIPFYVLYRPDQEPHVFSELISKSAILDLLGD